MRIPIQTPSITRGNQIKKLKNAVLPSGCSVGSWFECAGLAVACAAACVVTEGEACIECLGPSYDTCKNCF
jgi:hypothetical protein